MSVNHNFTQKEIQDYLDKNDMEMKIISEKYINSKAKMKFICKVCEHEFMKDWNSIRRRGESCPVCGKNGKRLSKKEMRQIVESHNCKLLSFLQGDSVGGSRFIVACDRGHEYKTTLRNFIREYEHSRGVGCKDCSREGFSRRRKEASKNMIHMINELGFSLVGEQLLKNEHENREFKCKNGHIKTTNCNALKRSPVCQECEGRILRHTEETIAKELSEIGLIYYDGFKNNSRDTIRYFCDCGKLTNGDLYSIKRGVRCDDCSYGRHFSFEEVKEYYESFSCKLLEKSYVNTSTVMEFQCECGNIHSKTFDSFRKSPKCPVCIERNRPRGENHFLWNPNKTDEERQIDRKYAEYDFWRNAVYERDSYTCQCCGDDSGGNLNAHHIYNYSEHKELQLEVSNGLTMCKTCHKNFHDTYGYTKNNKEQLEEFLQATLII